jgi:hypothetical protein
VDFARKRDFGAGSGAVARPSWGITPKTRSTHQRFLQHIELSQKSCLEGVDMADFRDSGVNGFIE